MPDSKAKGGVVHVSVPAGAANNLALMQKITASILGKLGCLGCHSGFDIRFIQEELNFKADIKGEITQGLR
jgi:hypothetical protein